METDTIHPNPILVAEALRKALLSPLPGTEAQKKMSPSHLISQPHQGVKPRTSAVLILLYPTSDAILMPFTMRLSTLAHHAGEICFPGGGVEENDPTLIHTALRETSEELGLNTETVQILGSITPIYISASQNMVHPIIGWIDERPTFNPCPFEVERVIEVPLKTLLNPLNIGEHLRKKNGQTLSAPCYRIYSDCIWGATAMILSEFISVVQKAL